MLSDAFIACLAEARSWCVLAMFVVWAVLVLFVLLRTARKALGRLTRATAIAFCGFAFAWSLCANKANTNSPPDGASGPLSTPRLLSDSPAAEPEGDAVGVTNLQFTTFDGKPWPGVLEKLPQTARLPSGSGWE